jgi:hypothetical protein
MRELLTTHGMPLGASAAAADDTDATRQRPTVGEMLAELATAFRTLPNFRNAVLSMSLLPMVYASSQFMQLWLVANEGMEQTAASSLYGGIDLFVAIPRRSLAVKKARLNVCPSRDLNCRRWGTDARNPRCDGG